MFLNKKLKMVVAVICAAMTLSANIVFATATPYGFRNVEDVRSKALSEYFTNNRIIAMSTANLYEHANSVTVTYENETVVETLNYSTVKRLNESLSAGETVVVREGVEGEKAVTYSVKYENGVEVSREVVSTVVTKEPVIKIVEYGTENSAKEEPATSSSEAAKLDYSYYIDCEATAYDLSPEENGGYGGQSATGVPLDKGVIAVDPKVIPLGSRVYIEAIDGSWSYGYAVAADTGGAIKGKRVDLCYRTQKECVQFGRRPCRVYILN